MTDPATEIARRRTFAIISHPDAGKTTLTEHLLRAGGAIQLAGNVRAKGERRRTRSDWMGIERDRGISVVTSVMTFEHAGCVFNLLDTPGHEDFSEDTYRTLTAVDSAVMVIDAAKGIEARTRKLFEICRLRDIPIVTFINKMDRESRDPIELLDEIASTLALDTAPVTWPVGRAAEFAGTYDLRARALHLIAELPQSDPRLAALADEVDQIRAFSVADQRSLPGEVPEVSLVASRELLLTERVRERARGLRDDFPGLRGMLEKMAEGIPVEGMESLLPALADRMSQLT